MRWGWTSAAAWMGAMLGLACAATQSAGPVYSATAIVRINPTAAPSVGRRAALGAAERQARLQLLTDACQLRLTDGRMLDTLAIVDPFVRAVIDDTVRRAVVTDQTVSDEGIVTLTLRMDLEPLYKLIADYPKHPI